MKNTYKTIIAFIALIIIIVGTSYLAKKNAPVEVDQTPQAGAKLNIDVVCNSALAYTTFTDGAAAEAFVQDCKDGKHPEVIERYKKDMNLGDGANI